MENDGATKREKARKILLEQFLAGKHKESGFRDVVIAENRELMPELEEEFLKLEKINAAVQGADRSGVATDARQNSTLPKRGEVEVTDASQPGFSSVKPQVVVPNYQLLRCVGRGGFGEVWLARNVVTEDYHAVKILAEQCSLEVEGVRRYTEQVKSLAGLVPIKEVGKTDIGFYYVMPLADDVKGGAAIRTLDRYEPRTLAWCCKNKPPLMTEEIAHLGIHLLGILEDLHETGLTHCDVKPANIISVDGEWMLSDIGLMTRTDYFPTGRGTLEFLPPERRCDHSADLYALAKTLFLLATGASVYRFDEFIDGSLKLQVESPESNQLRQVLGKACHPDADARYIAARDMCNDLKAVLDACAQRRTSQTPEPQSAPQHQVGLKREPLWLAAVAVLLLVVVGLSYKSFYGPKRIAADADVPVFLAATHDPPLILRAWQDIVTAQDMDGEMVFSVSVQPEGISEVMCMDRAKDGPELAVGGNKGVAILDAHSAEKIGQIQTESSVTAVCWMPAAKQLFLAQNSGIELWENDSDFQSQERQRIARTSLSATATCLAWSSDVELLAVGTKQGRVLLMRKSEDDSSVFESFEMGADLGEVKAVSWLPGSPLVAIGLEKEIRLWWINTTRDEGATIEHELVVNTASGRNLVWVRKDLLNVSGDAVEKWQFTTAGNWLDSPDMSSKKRLQFDPDHFDLRDHNEHTVGNEEQVKNEEVPEDVVGNIDLEIVGTLVVNRDNQDPTDGITTSYVTVRNQGTTRYDKSISEAILTLTLPHLPEDTINSWHKVIPSLDPGEEKEVVMYNGNFQTDQAQNSPWDSYEIIYEVDSTNVISESNESNNVRNGRYTPGSETYN